METFEYLNNVIASPLIFNSQLPFNEEDKKLMPWLSLKSRFYGIEKHLNTGGKAIALKGFISDETGNSLDEFNKPIVIKVPNLDTENYTVEQINDYLDQQSSAGRSEWQLTRERLRGCKYANPIFDFDIHMVPYLGDLVFLPLTTQFYLDDAVSLDDYLRDSQGKSPIDEDDNWNGIKAHDQLIKIALSIATGLADIHQRRVVHGDIWPPNIFIKKEENDYIYPIFIDFGESFPIEPRGVPREQRDHAYRAPERKDAQTIITQMTDVYSFGKLLLYLVTGKEPILNSVDKGHLRREKIREKIEAQNPDIITDNPYILDIICKCVTLDPIDRPNMSEVLRAFNTYINPKHSNSGISDRLKLLGQTWKSVTGQLANRSISIGPFLEDLVQQRINDIEDVMKGLVNDVISLNDTRERLILDLIILFQRLNKNDRFISVSHPSIWQGSALGLDGRYFTATQLAIRRGASIQRTFLFSIEEIGTEWALKWIKNLNGLNKDNDHPLAGKLIDLLKIEIAKYHRSEKTRKLTYDNRKEARERLSLVIKSYFISSTTTCKQYFNHSEFHSFKKCEGPYLGLYPVSTVHIMNELKASHPVSVFSYNSPEDQDQYLLLRIDCLGRNSSYCSDEALSNNGVSYTPKLELKGITVYKSVLGIPQDRIKRLEQLFIQSISIGGWIEDLYKTLPNEDEFSRVNEE